MGFRWAEHSPYIHGGSETYYVYDDGFVYIGLDVYSGSYGDIRYTKRNINLALRSSTMTTIRVVCTRVVASTPATVWIEVPAGNKNFALRTTVMLLTLSLIMWMVMAMQLITLMEEVVYFGIPADIISLRTSSLVTTIRIM